MKRFVMTISILALVAGAALFPNQIVAQFRGMSPLEAMKTIVTFVLHVAVATIAAYVMYTLPEILGPTIKMLKNKSARIQTGRQIDMQKTKTPRLNTDQMLRLYIAQQMNKGSRRESTPPASNDDIHLQF
jgi:hypothetical protein